MDSTTSCSPSWRARSSWHRASAPPSTSPRRWGPGGRRSTTPSWRGCARSSPTPRSSNSASPPAASSCGAASTAPSTSRHPALGTTQCSRTSARGLRRHAERPSHAVRIPGLKLISLTGRATSPSRCRSPAIPSTAPSIWTSTRRVRARAATAERMKTTRGRAAIHDPRSRAGKISREGRIAMTVQPAHRGARSQLLLT